MVGKYEDECTCVNKETGHPLWMCGTELCRFTRGWGKATHHFKSLQEQKKPPEEED